MGSTIGAPGFQCAVQTFQNNFYIFLIIQKLKPNAHTYSNMKKKYSVKKKLNCLRHYTNYIHALQLINSNKYTHTC